MRQNGSVKRSSIYGNSTIGAVDAELIRNIKEGITTCNKIRRLLNYNYFLTKVAFLKFNKKFDPRLRY